MTFFVSENLKNRISESDFLEDKDEKENINEGIFVKAFLKEKVYRFEFISFSKKANKKELVVSIPETYRYLNQVINNDTIFKIYSYNNCIEHIKFKNSEWQIIKQNERSYYLLKIITDI